MITIGSMCTGYGGLDAGVMSALGTGTLAWTADNDPGASAIIAHRIPGVPNLGDIRQVDWAQVPPVHVLCAGFPCQPVSAAGKQKGLQDDRWLWPDIAAAISHMAARPALLVLENVPRLLTIDGGRALSQVIGSLAELGYVGCYGVYSAAEAGAAHLRKRWFLTAADADSESRLQWRLPATPETESRRSRPDPGRPDRAFLPDAAGIGRTSRRAAADRDRAGTGHRETIPDPGSGKLQRRRGGRVLGEKETVESGERNQRQWPGNTAPDSYPEVIPDADDIILGQDTRELAERTSSWEWTGPGTDRRLGDYGKRAFPDPGSPRLERTVTARAGDDQERYRQAEDGAAGRSPGSGADPQFRLFSTPRASDGGWEGDENGRGRRGSSAGWGLRNETRKIAEEFHGPELDWREYGPAVRRWEMISGYEVPCPVEPGRNGKNRMTAKFPEWLMGLPPGWVTGVPGLSRSAQIRAIGNGVVPHQAAMAVTSLLGRLYEADAADRALP